MACHFLNSVAWSSLVQARAISNPFRRYSKIWHARIASCSTWGISILISCTLSNTCCVAGVSATLQDRFYSAFKAGHETHTREQNSPNYRITKDTQHHNHIYIVCFLINVCLTTAKHKYIRLQTQDTTTLNTKQCSGMIASAHTASQWPKPAYHAIHSRLIHYAFQCLESLRQ